jgi:hypothetical protein
LPLSGTSEEDCSVKRKRKSELDEAFWDRALENAQRLRELAIENQRRHDEAKKKREAKG